MAWRNRNIGLILAGIWLLLTGLIPILDIHINNLNLIMALLAIAAGVLLLMGR